MKCKLQFRVQGLGGLSYRVWVLQLLSKNETAQRQEPLP